MGNVYFLIDDRSIHHRSARNMKDFQLRPGSIYRQSRSTARLITRRFFVKEAVLLNSNGGTRRPDKRQQRGGPESDLKSPAVEVSQSVVEAGACFDEHI